MQTDEKPLVEPEGDPPGTGGNVVPDEKSGAIQRAPEETLGDPPGTGGVEGDPPGTGGESTPTP
jgi:hypothetical protein